MNAPRIKIIYNLGLFIAGIVLLFSQSCSPKIPASTPAPTLPGEASLTPTKTPVAPTATNTPRPATPTATLAPPPFIPIDYTFPSQFLARLTLGKIEAFALSPQSDLLAVANASHTCLFTTKNYERIWCSLTQPQIEMVTPEYANYNVRVHRLAFRPDGEQLAIALWNGYIVILGTSEGEHLNVIQTQRGWIRNLVWSADGKNIMLNSLKGGIEIWGVSSGALIRQLDIDPKNVFNSAWSSDGSVYATSGNDRKITLWDTNQDEPISTIEIPSPGSVSSMVWSPDNSKLYAGIATDFPCTEDCDRDNPEYKGWVMGWFVDDGDLFQKTSVGDIIDSLAISPDGKWLAAGGELYGSFIVLDESHDSMNARLTGTHAGKGVGWLDNNRALYLPDPEHVDAMSISQWNIAWSEHTEILLKGFETIFSMAWLPDNERVVTNSAGGTLSIWEARTGERLDQFQLFVGSLPLSKFEPSWISPVEPWLVVSAEGSLAIVDLEQRQVLQWLEHEDIASNIYLVNGNWSRDGHTLVVRVGNADRAGMLTIAAWDIRTGQRLLTIPKEDDIYILNLELSPDGKQLALSEENQKGEFSYRLVVIDLASGKELQSLDVDYRTFEIKWIAQDQIAFQNYATTHIWNLTQGTDQEIVGSPGFQAIRPDGNLAANGWFDVGIYLWNVHSGEEIVYLKAKFDYFGYHSLAFSPDGTLLAGRADHGSLLLWDVSAFLKP